MESYLNFPDGLMNIWIFDKFGLALTVFGYNTTNMYLVNLEYPSQPAILEIVESNCTYGIIKDDMIYLLGDGLKVFLIKKTD